VGRKAEYLKQEKTMWKKKNHEIGHSSWGNPIMVWGLKNRGGKGIYVYLGSGKQGGGYKTGNFKS